MTPLDETAHAADTDTRDAAPDDDDPGSTASRTKAAGRRADGQRPRRGPKLGAGGVIGRYVLLEPLGKGGMGLVYKAYDPHLDRKLAIKLLRDHQSHDAHRRDRLLREAQALAQLAHPNVIAVHDVGVHDGSVFMAMELVDGETLRAWLARAARTPAEIVRVMIAVGVGLAAAHRAGLVHRDVKPSNIMVGADGRVRVLDFGLARHGDETPPAAPAPGEVTAPLATPPEPVAPGDSVRSMRLLESPLTEFGAVVGTPRYMAPEQHAGGAVDARADQFAFCVCLYEALCGGLPFAATQAPERLAQITSGVRAQAAREAALRPRLRAAIVRGLAARPEDRWPTMDALLDQLRRDPRARRARIAIAVAAVAGAGALATASLWPAAPPVCGDAAARVADVWSPARRAEVTRAFAATGRAFAADAASRTSAALDEFAARWSAMQTDACRATRVHHTQAPETFARQSECLERRLAQVGQLVGLLAHADGALVDRATRAVHVVGELATCVAPSAEPAPGPADRAAVAAIRAELDRGDVLERAGQARAAHDLAATAVAAAERTAHAPTQARALFLLAQTADAIGDGRAAEAALERALDAAARSADPPLLADAWVRMFGVIGAVQDRFADAARIYRVAQLSVIAAGDPPALRLRLLRDLGSMQLEQGELEAARATFRDLLAREEARPTTRKDELATALNNLGAVEVELGDFEAARRDLARAVELIEADLGPAHPSLSFPLVNLGLVLQDQGRFLESIPYLERAHAIERAALGADSPELAGTESALAAALTAADRLDEARGFAEHSVAVRERLLGPDHPDLAWSLATRAAIDARQHRLEAARAGYERVIAIRTQALGADHAETAAARAALADFECVDGDPARGARLAAAAADAAIATFGAAHPRTQSLLVDAARCQPSTTTGPWPGRLRQAVTILDAIGADPAARAAARVELARATFAADPAAARALATAAIAIAGDAAPVARDAAQAWLAAHPAR